MRLDVETRPYHASVDAAWCELLADDVTDTGYASQLARVYGFEAPLEAVLAYTPNLALVIDIKRRLRAGFLAQDLVALDVPPVQIAQLPSARIEPFVDVAEALGWLYVLERATAIHPIVRKHLLEYRPELAVATAYLSTHDGSLGARWLELGDALDRVAEYPGKSERIMLAAFDGFRRAIDWYQRSGAGRLRRAG
jgi:heme oxygenase